MGYVGSKLLMEPTRLFEFDSAATSTHCMNIETSHFGSKWCFWRPFAELGAPCARLPLGIGGYRRVCVCCWLPYLLWMGFYSHLSGLKSFTQLDCDVPLSPQSLKRTTEATPSRVRALCAVKLTSRVRRGHAPEGLICGGWWFLSTNARWRCACQLHDQLVSPDWEYLHDGLPKPCQNIFWKLLNRALIWLLDIPGAAAVGRSIWDLKNPHEHPTGNRSLRAFRSSAWCACHWKALQQGFQSATQTLLRLSPMWSYPCLRGQKFIKTFGDSSQLPRAVKLGHEHS